MAVSFQWGEGILMTMRLLFIASFLLPFQLHAQQTAIAADPVADKTNPARMEAFQLPSHGAQLNALVYVAAGAGPHPVVILLHGFPGNERNLDLAQAMRRAGYDVLYFNYRGSWGSPGEFSFTHSLEDVASAIAYLREPEHAKKLRADAGKIILIGHSMGGFMAYHAGALDPAIKAVAGISAADMARSSLIGLPPAVRPQVTQTIAKGLAKEGMAPLAGCTPEGLAEELITNAKTFSFSSPALVSKLANRPILIVTSDDGLAAPNNALAASLKKSGNEKVTTLHLATDHSFSDQRIALQTAVLDWLAKLP